MLPKNSTFSDWLADHDPTDPVPLPKPGEKASGTHKVVGPADDGGSDKFRNFDPAFPDGGCLPDMD